MPAPPRPGTGSCELRNSENIDYGTGIEAPSVDNHCSQSPECQCPAFFFDTHDGDHLVPDETGLELDDLEAAKVEAQKALPDVAKEKLSDGHQRVFMVSVRDEAGQVLMRIALALRVEYFSQAQG